jgi:predicted membrane-bound mannosyltransferase
MNIAIRNIVETGRPGMASVGLGILNAVLEQAVKFATLLETGEYRYDPNDHHGPTLYYFTLPSAWVRGQKTLASLDERTLRVVPALFGAGLILLIFTLRRDLGPTEVAASALLAWPCRRETRALPRRRSSLR